MARILLVEDDPLMIRLYQKILTLENYTVDIAENGEVALAKITSARPDLILLDIMMPKLNGIQVLDRLKSDPATKSIPVFMLTNLASQNDAQSTLAKGATKYLIKSQYEPRQIVDMVKSILNTV